MSAQVLVVVSGKGGVGKSSLCAMVGLSLAAMGKKVLLMEMDCGLRSLDILLGASDRTVYDLSDALSGRCSPAQAVTATSCPNLGLVAAPLRPDTPCRADGFAGVCRSLSGSCDYLIVEVPAGFGPAFDAAVPAADMALLVVTPDLVCVRDARVVSDYLDEKGLTCQRLLINRLDRKMPGRRGAVADLDSILDRVGEPLLGVVPEDPDTAGRLMKGLTPQGNAAAAVSCRNIARRLCGEYAELSVL